MASRRSRRAQSGSGGVQEQLASLAGIQQLMGDPLKDLAGLMQLQQMSEASAQGPRDEARSMRNEEFVRGQAELKQENEVANRKQTHNLAKAQWDLTNKQYKLEEARGTRQERVAAANLQVAESNLQLKQDEAKQSKRSLPPVEIIQQLRVLEGLARGGILSGDTVHTEVAKTLMEFMREYGYVPDEDVEVGVPSPTTPEDTKAVLNKVRREAPPVTDWMGT